MKNGDKPIRNPFVVLREEFDDWAILFNPDTGHGFGLNPTGVYLWKLLDGTRTIKAIANEARLQTKDVAEPIARDISAFVDELVAEGLVGFDLWSDPRSPLDSHAVHAVEGVTYARPALVGFVDAAHGAQCHNGSSALTCNTYGNSPTGTATGCIWGNNATSGSTQGCWTGNIATQECYSGFTNTGGPCTPTGSAVY